VILGVVYGLYFGVIVNVGVVEVALVDHFHVVVHVGGREDLIDAVQVVLVEDAVLLELDEVAGPVAGALVGAEDQRWVIE
jgi:hypothetical protein